MATLLITDSDNWITNKQFRYLLWFQPSLWGILIKTHSITIFLDNRYFDLTKKLNKKKILSTANKEHLYFKNIKWALIDEMLMECSSSKTLKLEERLTLKYYDEINKKSNLWLFLNSKKIEIVWSYFKKQKLKKTRTEKIKIKKAIKIIEEIYKEIKKLNESWNLIWKTEKDIEKFIIEKIIQLWWKTTSFDSIVAFGKNSSIAHYQTWKIKIWNWPLLIDMWAIFDWYCSDFTRTIWVWEKNENFEKYEKIYNIVKNAHYSAKKIVKPWISAREIDQKAREIITEAWYWEYFTHSTWHWVWLNIHEAPFINPRSEEIIEKDMVFTIEPWIYIPGNFWVRYENIVFV